MSSPKTIQEAIISFNSENNLKKYKMLKVQIDVSELNIDTFFKYILNSSFISELYKTVPNLNSIESYFNDIHNRFFKPVFWLACYNFAELLNIKKIEKGNKLFDICLRFDASKHFDLLSKYKEGIGEYNLTDYVRDENYVKAFENLAKEYKLNRIRESDKNRIARLLLQEYPKSNIGKNVFPESIYNSVKDYQKFYLDKINWMKNVYKKLKVTGE